MPTLTCSPHEVQIVKDALARNSFNGGIGILHEPTGSIRLIPIDDLPNQGGHAEFVQVLGFRQANCKGFGIILDPAGVATPVNTSHLNGFQGVSGSHQMPAAIFADIVRALQIAGL